MSLSSCCSSSGESLQSKRNAEMSKLISWRSPPNEVKLMVCVVTSILLHNVKC